MRKILGLDLGTTSIGWALVNEAENQDEKSSIIKLGVRIVPLSTDEQQDFKKGKSIATNAVRRLQRCKRRNIQRYKLRRTNLITVLKASGILNENSVLSEDGAQTTFQTHRLRAQAATKKIALEDFAKVLLMINTKRGYKSSRKTKIEEDGTAIDGISVSKELYENNITPGQYALSLLENNKKFIPEFYRSDLQSELDQIWNFQKQFHPDVLTDEFKIQLEGKGKTDTSKIFLRKYDIYTAENKGKEKNLQSYKWREDGLTKQLSKEELAAVFCEVNNALKKSSGYLGEISDRSKELYFNKQTVGQYIMSELSKDPHYSLKNKVFYRQDYVDEFETIWNKQFPFHKELTPALKEEVKNEIIFYQRPLKSQKGLINYCELESKQIEVIKNESKKTVTTGSRVCPKSSPLFQEFRMWQMLNNIEVKDKKTHIFRLLELAEKETLCKELETKEKLSKKEALELLFKEPSKLDLNFKEIIGNRTQASFLKAYQIIIERSGNGEYDFAKMSAEKVWSIVLPIFEGLKFSTNILHFNSELEAEKFEAQPLYQFWHLLYSFEGDDSKSGIDKLVNKISKLYGFEKEYAIILANIAFEEDYCSLSTKAMRKILPFMKEGIEYSEACVLAGYNHSKRSLTTEDLDKKQLKDSLEIIPRNSLRNPVVEKILNQMINVVNGVVSAYGKPSEIRIELARELKENSEERADLTAAISKSTSEHEKYRGILQKNFNIQNVSRNDIIRYKLYLELKDNGYRTLYSNTYIPQEKLFSKDFEIEHIIPKSRLFDDSFSNKTLETSGANKEKDNRTAIDYVSDICDQVKKEEYLSRIKYLDEKGTRGKYKKLTMTGSEIPDGFIDRDLRNTQYVSKKAREILEDMCRVVTPTTGSITDRLRQDWQLINVMQELSWNKYKNLGLTETIEGKDGQKIDRIKGWTKRNDHRHHAMDALTVAFTKHSYIQYLNNLNARSDKSGSIYAIEKKELYRDKEDKLRFNPPMPLNDFRAEAKEQLESILISFKAKNKVCTHNINKTCKKNGLNITKQLTPRGQLHKEKIYGRISQYVTKEESIGAKFDVVKAETVASKKYREALLLRLYQYENDPKKAFTGKNSLDKKPIFVDKAHPCTVPLKVKTVTTENIYTICEEINKDLNIEKVIDSEIRSILTKRLEKFSGKKDAAFSDLGKNPIWLNKEKGIAIKRVTIRGITSAVALHNKKDHNGQIMMDKDGYPQSIDFVSTGNNHHIAIYRDAGGNLQEVVVPFMDAVSRVIGTAKLPVVDKSYRSKEGWTFLFSMKKNEYFIFPNNATGFDPKAMDEKALKDPVNYTKISPNLFRVQKITSKDYSFRHHLETTVDENNELQDICWKRITCLPPLKDIVKVRINHIGQIVQVGEY